MKYIYTPNTRRTALTCAGAVTLLFFSSSAQACSDEAYIGSICATANNYCPKDYAKAEGQLLTITDNAALYSLLGTNFGGNGTSNFQLPDLRSRTPVGIGGPLALTIGTQYGQETVTLTEAQMAIHSHNADYTAPEQPVAYPFEIHASQTAAQKEVPATGDMFAATPMNGFTPTTSTAIQVGGHENSSGANIAVSSTGGGQPFSIIDPQTSAQYCIKMKGLYPPRSDYD